MHEKVHKHPSLIFSLDILLKQIFPDAALHRCSYIKVVWKYPAKLQENTHAEKWVIGITLWHGCSVNLLFIVRISSPKNTSGGLLLYSTKISLVRRFWRISLLNFYWGFFSVRVLVSTESNNSIILCVECISQEEILLRIITMTFL